MYLNIKDTKPLCNLARSGGYYVNKCEGVTPKENLIEWAVMCLDFTCVNFSTEELCRVLGITGRQIAAFQAVRDADARAEFEAACE